MDTPLGRPRVVHQPLALFDANIFYPLRNTLALSENLLQRIYRGAGPLITGNPVLAVNVVSLLVCALRTRHHVPRAASV